MTRLTKFLIGIFGIGCTAIGTVHFLGGAWTVPWIDTTTAAVDNRDRFNSAIFVGYGLAWVWAYMQPTIPVRLVRFLSVVFFAGGIGRILSWVFVGQPHWFQIVLLVIELTLPLLFLGLVSDPKKLAQSQT